MLSLAVVLVATEEDAVAIDLIRRRLLASSAAS